MDIAAVTRRTFIAASAGAFAALAAGTPRAADLDARPAPTGPVYGRAGGRGIPPGTASAPSRGEVVLLDGRVLEVSHVTGRGIRPGGSVWLAPDGDEGWSILYAEFGEG
jgi:hypothetical protein